MWCEENGRFMFLLIDGLLCRCNFIGFIFSVSVSLFIVDFIVNSLGIVLGLCMVVLGVML